MAATVMAVHNGMARKSTTVYAVNNGVTVKPSKLYAVNNSKTVLLGGGAFEFSYTGDYDLQGSLDSDFVLSFLTSGTLTITALGNASSGVDICCVAGGENGNKAAYETYNYNGMQYHGRGGAGGNGGAVVNTMGLTLTEGSYEITVGDVASASSFGELATASGTGADGGYGGNQRDVNAKTAAVAGGDGTCAFGDESCVTAYPAGTKFGAGGGGGFGWWNNNSYAEAAGGDTGGGDGGTTDTIGDDATIPGGGGGGGGGIAKTLATSEAQQYLKAGGSGYKGIVIMRNAA